MPNNHRRPTRIQRSRKKSSRQPEDTIYCGRGTAWGNSYKKGDSYFFNDNGDGKYAFTLKTNEDAVDLFRIYARQRLKRDPEWLEPLRKAKYVSCFCKLGEACHVDVLLEMLESEEVSNES